MTPLEFLAEVLPSSGHGYYCVAELTKKKEHAFINEIEEATPCVERWLEKKCDIYFALATYEEKGKRTTDNAAFVKAFFIDMDGYETKKAAALALSGFLEKTGLDQLGTPLIVSSGGGLHCYWPLTEAVEVSVWKPVAENLKRLCKQEGLAIDMTVTADAARVLRIPETFNFKAKYETPRPVKIMAQGNRFDFAALTEAIESKVEAVYSAPVVSKLEGQRPNRAPNAAQVKLMQNSETSFEVLWLKTEAGTGCGQLDNYVKNATEDGMEPIWRGLLSWAQKCEDGPSYAEWLSDLHPYPRERMHQKLGEIKGPYACAKMDSENPGVCNNCPHWGKITNPLALGRQIKTDDTEKQIVLPVSQVAKKDDDAAPSDDGGDTGAPLRTVTRPKAPRGFTYGTHGGVYCEREEKDGEGKKFTKHVQILAYDLFVVDILKQESDHTVHMVATRPDQTVTLTMPVKAVVSKEETVKCLAGQNVIAAYGQNNDKNLFDYVRACVEEASMLKKAIEVPTQAGWQKDGSFVYNNRVFMPNGTETTIPMPGMENINKNTNNKGSLDEWRKAWNLLSQRKMYTMLAMCVDSFGAPLMRFTEYDGFVWHIGSTESGTGKSLTLAMKASVWGHPTRYRTGKGTSPVAMQNRLGLLNSLPMLIDEITSKSRADLEWAPAFIFDVSEAQGKERMEAGANKERINNSTWATTVTMTSNTHLTDYMSGARKHSSNGELLRMLEWTPTVPLVWTDEEREIIKGIKQNYGVAGEAWVRWMVTHQEDIKQMLKRVHDRLKTVMDFSDDERYWHAACTEVVTAAILLGPKYAGLLSLPIEGITAALKELVENARKNMKRGLRTAEDVLNAYTRDNYGSFIIIRKNEDKRILASWGSGEMVDRSTTRSKVLGRVEHDTINVGQIEYFLEEQLLKQHCVSMSFGYADFKKKIAAQYAVNYVKKDLLAKTNGPSMRVNVMHISRQANEADTMLNEDGSIMHGDEDELSLD